MTSPDWQIDAAAANSALELLRKARFVLMPTHQNVDADGLASPLALMSALEQFGIRAVPLVTDGKLASSLRFIPGIDQVLIYGKDPLPDYDLLCLIDCSDRRRLGAFYDDDPLRIEGGAVPIINIDHHVTNDHFGVVNIVAPEASSSAEVVAVLLNLWRTELTEPIAQCLLAGIYGDTLGLRTDSTTARTMRTAADLIDAGAEPRPIVEALFQRKSRATVCLWEQVLRTVTWTGALVWTEVTQDVLSRCGAKASEAEGLVNFLVGTEGSRAAAILYQTDQGWRVSLRSLRDDVDVAMIAAHFSGGGHPRAAGCSIIGDEAAKDAFLERVAELTLSQEPIRT